MTGGFWRRSAARARAVPAWGLATVVVAGVFAAFSPLLNSTITVDETSELHFRGALPAVESERPMWSAAASAWHAVSADWTPRGQHVLSISVHAVNAVLVYVLALALFTLSRAREGRANWFEHAAALVAALLFALHPQRVEALGWTEQLPLIASAGLCLATVLLYLRATGRGWAALTCLGASALSPLGLGMPVLLMLLDVWPLRRWSAAPGRVVLEKIALLLMAAGVLVWVGEPGLWIPGAGTTWWQRLLVAAHDATRYVRDFVFPMGLAPGREAPTPVSWWGWPYLAGWVGVLVLLATAAWYRRRVPAMLLGAASYLLVLAPAALLMLRAPEAGADRFSYLPAVVLALGCGAALVAVFRRESVEARGFGCAAVAMVLVATGPLGWLTFRQCERWATTARLWEHALAVRSNSALVELRLARWAEGRGDLERAGQLYYLAQARRANWLAPVRGLGATQLLSGQAERAAETYGRALRLAPDSATSHYEYAVALAAAGEAARALEHFRRGTELAPVAPAPWVGWSRVLRQMGNHAEAERVLAEARRRLPGEPSVKRELDFYLGNEADAAPAPPGAAALPAGAPGGRPNYQE